MNNQRFCYKFLLHMIDNMDIVQEDEAKKMFRSCSCYHYNVNKMDELLVDYIGNLDEFIKFLTSEWGWIISFDNEKGIILADENKDYCVCPIVAEADGKKVSDKLCYCSEGFAEKLFSKVLESKVEVRIVSSILRGDKNCVYEILI